MDQVTNERLQTGNQGFCDGFIKSIIESNRSKLGDGFRIGNFWDEANESGVQLRGHLLKLEDTMDKSSDRVSNNIPIFLEKYGMKPIRPRRL